MPCAPSRAPARRAGRDGSADVGLRRRAREGALQALCFLEHHPELSVDQGLALFFDHLAGSRGEDDAAGEDEPGTGEGRSFVERIVRGVHGRREEIDERLTAASQNWRLERMARVDRNLLRLAAFEILCCDDIPPKVAINEAVEIAKAYSTRESAAFVNGILDRVLSTK